LASEVAAGLPLTVSSQTAAAGEADGAWVGAGEADGGGEAMGAAVADGAGAVVAGGVVGAGEPQAATTSAATSAASPTERRAFMGVIAGDCAMAPRCPPSDGGSRREMSVS
jgi:hypothetical protein